MNEILERKKESLIRVYGQQSSGHETGLPERCFSRNAVDGSLIGVKRFEVGYYAHFLPVTDAEVDELNNAIGVNQRQRLAMECQSMVGYHEGQRKLLEVKQ